MQNRGHGSSASAGAAVTVMETIAIDLGGTKVKMGVVSDGRVVTSAGIDSDSLHGFGPLVPKIKRICRDWQRQYDISGLGIAFPSLVDADKKQVLGHNNKFPDCVGFDFEGWVRESFGLPMVLENDANAAALGEMGYGAARDSENFVLMILGTGIGTAAVMDGRLIRGKHYQAGNLFGHIPLKRNGRSCLGCPGTGCAEAQASTWALKFMVEESSMESPMKREAVMNFEILRRYYNAGDKLAKEIFEECCDYWSSCLITLVYAYDPETVVLSGGVLNWGRELPDRIFRTVEQRAWTSWGKLDCRLAREPDQSVLLGLHYLNETLEEKEKRAL